ncbi:DUF6615 family protein [Anabaena azotica]|uniref:Uncharacterized protein n=1 Tax=Anabaena azotica FACHB-119 TaxID=947527 RepID=A0ABR8DGS6_9NOST|nr:DUF6615 family protein [Anabaena azotica]MBD2505311.1 hypothetical protein [Anabaena azotica FACHB-119]
MYLDAVRKKLYDSAGYIRFWLTKQPGVKEESITDWLLFDVSNELSNILYHAFTRHQEGRETGADWEWWFLFSQDYIRLRVQAKKVSSTEDNYPEIARTNRHGLQIEKLLKASEQANAVPLYALYSSVSGDVRCKKQQIVQNDGVFIAGAQQIYDSFIRGSRQKVTSADLLKLSSPFSCFACCPLVTTDGDGLLHRYLEYYFRPEVMPVSLDSKNFRGLHRELPDYLSSFLENARFGELESWENNFESELQDFNALLVYDFRDCGTFAFDDRLTCSGNSWSQGRTDELEF